MYARACICLCLLVVLVASGAHSLFAQEVQFTAGVNRSEVALGEQFQVTFTLAGGSLKQYSDFRAPDLNKDFLTLAGPSTSQSMQIINGRMSSSISWTYVLQGRGVGTFTIPPATLKYEGQTLRTNTLRMKISRAVPGTGQPSGRSEEHRDIDLGDNLFIRAIPNKRTVFLGEPITVTYKLYSRVAFQLDSPIKLPRMIGFWSEDVETPRQLRPSIEVYNGKQYETYMMRKVLYFPTQAGSLTIDPFEVAINVRVRKRRQTGDDYFDRFFSDPFFDSYENVKKTLMTGKIPVTVKPLPEENKPAGFTGVVGSYEMDVSLDRDSLKANETAALKVVLRGRGNIRLLDEPRVTFPTGIDHYDPTIKEDARPADGTMRGSKSFEYLLVPRFPGRVSIPPVEFSYFDLDRKRYVTHTSPSFTLQIAEGDVVRQAGDLEQRMIDYLAMDVRPVKNNAGSLKRENSGVASLQLVLLLYMLPWVACIGALIWKRRYDKLHSDIVGLKRRRATRVAERRLSRSKAFLERGDIEAYYLEIARALWGYAQDSLALPTSQVTILSVVERLEARGVHHSTATKLRDALNSVEYARFSPTRASEQEMRALYDTAKEAIITAEQALRERTV